MLYEVITRSSPLPDAGKDRIGGGAPVEEPDEEDPPDDAPARIPDVGDGVEAGEDVGEARGSDHQETTMSDSQPTWIGRTIGGRYKIESLLGQGGMSSVYKATDPNLQRTVAVKLIHPHLSQHAEFVKRFEQEAAAVAKLRHPNIIQVHDFNNDQDIYYSYNFV